MSSSEVFILFPSVILGAAPPQTKGAGGNRFLNVACMQKNS